MPEWKKKLEKKLEKEAEKKGITGDRKKAYIYGTAGKIEKKKTGKITHHRKGSRKKEE
jgi:hypothetical protein